MYHKVTFSNRLHFLLAVFVLACILTLGTAGTNDGEVRADGGGQTDTLPSPGSIIDPAQTGANATDDEPLGASSIEETIIIWANRLLLWF